jgi:hypothetical protein
MQQVLKTQAPGYGHKKRAIADPARLRFFYFVVLGFSLLSSPLLLSLPDLRSGM